MKKLPTVLLLCVLTILTRAADSAQKKTPPPEADTPSIPASAAKLTAPMVLKDGVLSQPERTEITDGGKAVFEFTVPKDGDYAVHAVVESPDDDTNSFYVNVDKQPTEDPLMTWDIELTNGFEDRVVSWRGNGEAGSNEFTPKIFKLTAGAHKLYFVGREPAKLKSISIRPASK